MQYNHHGGLVNSERSDLPKLGCLLGVSKLHYKQFKDVPMLQAWEPISLLKEVMVS